MRTHVKIVHEGIKQYQCELCWYAGGKPGNLRSHMEAKHGLQKNDPVSF